MRDAATDLAPSIANDEDKISAWIEANMGGSVQSCTRDPRWRPGWRAELLRNGVVTKLYVRGERLEKYPPWPLEHEAGAFQILEKHGIPVPHIYGICDDPHATVMDVMPGRANLATAKDEAERLSVLNHLAEIMARMHAIDPVEMMSVGAPFPASDREISLSCYDLCDQIYLEGRKAPDPRIAFLRRWVENNIPRGRNKLSMIAVDSGQFLFEDGKVTSLLDLEYACIGDPMIDIAVLGLRANYEPMGDLVPLFRRYRELTGDEFPLDVLVYHLVWWSLSTPLIIEQDLRSPLPQAAYPDYVAWYLHCMIVALEALADLKGIELDHGARVEPARPSRWAPLFDVIAARSLAPRSDESYEAQQQRLFLDFAVRLDGHPDVEEDYLREAERILGHPVEDSAQADRELEQYVATVGSEQDEALIRMFHKWCRAQAATLMTGFVEMPTFKGPSQSFSAILRGLDA